MSGPVTLSHPEEPNVIAVRTDFHKTLFIENFAAESIRRVENTAYTSRKNYGICAVILLGKRFMLPLVIWYEKTFII